VALRKSVRRCAVADRPRVLGRAQDSVRLEVSNAIHHTMGLARLGQEPVHRGDRAQVGADVQQPDPRLAGLIPRGQ
jgi:hypothetical protein